MLDIDITFQRDNFHLECCAQLTAPITGVLGASGSGKSTLLSVIAGLLKPQSGLIALNNQCLLNTEQKLFVPPHKRRIGLVFQDAQLLPHMSVRKNLLYGYENILPEQRKFELDAVVSLLDIESLLERKPNSLSGGEKQRVALGRAILYSPSLLLLDEPLSALDEPLKNQILPFFLQIQSECKIPMIYVTHSSREVKFLTDTWLTMSNGKIIPNQESINIF